MRRDADGTSWSALYERTSGRSLSEFLWLDEFNGYLLCEIDSIVWQQFRGMLFRFSDKGELCYI